VIASYFYLGLQFLKVETFSTYQTFYAEYDSVEGLAMSAPITLNGLVIGKVTVIKIIQYGVN
jgi:phospholipid/cholesterol/gamma-HCH transport system substrate-binding protein